MGELAQKVLATLIAAAIIGVAKWSYGKLKKKGFNSDHLLLFAILALSFLFGDFGSGAQMVSAGVSVGRGKSPGLNWWFLLALVAFRAYAVLLFHSGTRERFDSAVRDKERQVADLKYMGATNLPDPELPDDVKVKQVQRLILHYGIASTAIWLWAALYFALIHYRHVK